MANKTVTKPRVSAVRITTGTRYFIVHQQLPNNILLQYHVTILAFHVASNNWMKNKNIQKKKQLNSHTHTQATFMKAPIIFLDVVLLLSTYENITVYIRI